MADADEERWGFDEAHIETSRRVTGADQKPAEPVKPGNRRGLLIALLLLVLIAAGGFAGWQYLQRQPEPVQEVRTVPPIASETAAATPEATFEPAAAPATSTIPLTDSTATSAPGTSTAAATPAPAVATPVQPVAPSTASPLPPVQPRGSERERYDAMAREYAANPEGKFTLQIQILCDPANLTKLMRAGGAEVWFVPQPLGERSCYRVFWGRYATREEAQRALASVPASARDANTAVKAVPGS